MGVEGPRHPQEAGAPDLVASTELTVVVDDEIQAARAVRRRAEEEAEEPRASRFLQDPEYFPVTRRQMKQSWRYFRLMLREGPPAVLDLRATVDRIAREGRLFDLVLVPERVNRAELLLLIDQGGSMVPFHPLSRRLVETAQRAGRLGAAGVWYFHDCPVEPGRPADEGYLYREPERQTAEAIPEVLNQAHPERTAALIFSDAGAARGDLEPERSLATVDFLRQLKDHVRRVAWLNPMPRARWPATTAGEIAQSVPMFEFSRRGLHVAIAVLRGHLVSSASPRPGPGAAPGGIG
jgi:uncharacterized protein with von Willebrand factor type A (vWA) domain